MEDVDVKPITGVTSFRLDTKLLENLKLVAKKEKTNVNTLVSQILESHLGWDLYASEVGWVVMLKAGMLEIIKALDTESITMIAKKIAKSGAKEIALFMRGKYGIEEWISITRDRARMSGFSLKEYRGKNKDRFVMHHDMGEKWSIFFKTYYETVFDELGAKVHCDFTENAIVIELENTTDEKPPY